MNADGLLLLLTPRKAMKVRVESADYSCVAASFSE